MDTSDFSSSRYTNIKLQGLRPPPLKLGKDSHKIRKPPMEPLLPRFPVIIHTVSPKIIHTNPNEFMAVVQGLTGIGFQDGSGTVTPAAQFASIEKTKSPEGRKPQLFDESLQMVEGIEIGSIETSQFRGILAPNPNALPPIPPKYFSPPNYTTSFSHLLRCNWDATSLQEESDNNPPNYKTSFSHLLRCIWDATSCREESEAAYHHMLQKIFEEGQGGLHTDPEIADAELLAILESENAFGREQEMEKLLLKCCNPDEENIQLSAIPIVGAAGIGKTTLARLIYEHRLVQEHFDIRVWVKVDGQEFNLHHAAQQILKLTMHMSCSIDGLNELDELVRDTLLGRKCLIIFDGVESMNQNVWLHMNKNWFDFVDVGSKVLITTPSEGVANLVANEPFELSPLSKYDGWSLYQQLSLVSSDFEEDRSGHVVKNLEALCGYVPLLLILVGSMMRYHDNLRVLISDVHLSDTISLPTFDASVSILLCVWALPSKLRQCLALCAFFPKGLALNRERIINLWDAHGLVKPSKLHDIGNSYFNQLLCRSFFTDISRNEYDDITEFRIPGLIHTIMQDVARIIWKEKVGVIGSISEDAVQLTLHSEGPEDVTTLILSSTLYSGANSLNYTFLAFQELKSLDLSCSGIRSLSDDICALRELKYLNLSHTFIERLPDSFTELSQLQTLDVSWCYRFKFLPKELRDLRDMTHLDLSKCVSLSYLPSGIGSLESLTSMPLFVLGKGHDCARLGELGMLIQLRGRLEITNLENVQHIDEASKAKLNQKKLHHLGLCWSEDVDDCFEVLEFLEPNQQLKILDLTGYMGLRFPGWISSMSSLIKISITNCGCKEVPSLGQLPLLKELQLKGMTNIECIGPEFYEDACTFPSLEQLGLYDMPNLFMWSGAGAWGSGEACRSLKTLTIEGCPRLKTIPTFRYLLDLIICNVNVELLPFLKRTRFSSLSSLLIKDMKSGIFLNDSTGWRSPKKLILFNTTWYKNNVEIQKFSELEHLGIAHCPQLRKITLRSKNALQKLHVVDCPNLENIYFSEEATNLTELVVDGCPELNYVFKIRDIRWLTKLIIRGSDKFICARNFRELEKLQYLYISECPLLEKELEMDTSPISHIPCVLLESHKVEYQGSKNSEEYL